VSAVTGIGNTAGAGARLTRTALWGAAVAVLALGAAYSLGVGRYPISFERVYGILAAHVLPIDSFWNLSDQRVVELIRAPRVLLAVLAGMGLAVSGATLQGVFRNPLVGPQIIGVSSGAAFGGALAILLFGGTSTILAFSIVFGLAAIVLVYWMSRIAGRNPVLMLVLSGVVVSAFFAALIALIKYVADPDDKLPAIVFWLMGSFATATFEKLAFVAPPIVIASLLLFAMRFRINVLSLGDEEAEGLGVRVEASRWFAIVCVTIITASVVAAAGIVGWVGLVVPHLARMIVGPDHRVLIPASALAGGAYLLAIDDVARVATASEIPLGVITALIGAPVFALLLRRTQGSGWKHD
jgi:iron complex transport system permease protein